MDTHLSCHLRSSFRREEEHLQYVHFMEVTKPISGVDNAIACVCLPWSNGGELEKAFDIARYCGQDEISAGEH